MPARARNTGFVCWNEAPFRQMTVAANVASGLKLRPHATRPDRRAIAAQAIKPLKLAHAARLAKRDPA